MNRKFIYIYIRKEESWKDIVKKESRGIWHSIVIEEKRKRNDKGNKWKQMEK